MIIKKQKSLFLFSLFLLILCGFFPLSYADSDDDDDDDIKFKVKEVVWDSDKNRLKVKGTGTNGENVSLYRSRSNTVIAVDEVEDDKWRFVLNDLSIAPCRIIVRQSDGQSDKKKVKDAPQNCSNKTNDSISNEPEEYTSLIKVANIIFDWAEKEQPEFFSPAEQKTRTAGGWYYRYYSRTGIYIGVNKESDVYYMGGKFGDTPKRQGSTEEFLAIINADGNSNDGNSNIGNAEYTILAANDLGMHCADQDYRIFSILPPYNVLNAQVLKKGAKPQLMSPADGIDVSYKSANSSYYYNLSNSDRQADASPYSITTTGLNLPGIFKSNFWQQSAQLSDTGIDKIGFIAYEALYPQDILSLFPTTADLGLPAPNVEELYLLGNTLQAEQSAMPGATNSPQKFHSYIENYPFFVNLPNGYIVNNFKRYAAEGIPISPIDDNGKLNPYPLMRIEARDTTNKVLASIDAVVPVAAEADCAMCHASQSVCNTNSKGALICDDIANANYPQVNFIEDEADAQAVIGDTEEQKVINSAKINIVRLHDFKHNTQLAGSEADGSNGPGKLTPNVVCANCHYSPALDLAHMGPNDDNGKEQTQHISMSRAMHSVHGSLAQKDALYADLFPIMPPPGADRDPQLAETILMETCYNCHPGKNVKCLRGAMGGSGTVCQDCHGQLSQVGDDFSKDFPKSGFANGADFNKRVSWMSEPACDSCHIGDVVQIEQLKQSGQLHDTVINTHDSQANPDNLRLLLAYRLSDHKSHGGPDNLPLLKFSDSRFATTEALYRLSGADNGTNKGHGGLSCAGCHGSTHAIWPNKISYSNDNKAANDLQGHAGTIIECSTCHEGNLGNTLKGPHGMHPVGDTRFSDGGHEDMAEDDADACRACHGLNGEGTVLSRAAINRVLKNEDKSITVAKGDMISCTLCHKNEL